MAGLLDFEDPQQAGLLALAQGLFAAGAPQNRRVGLGEALAGGIGNMQQAQMQAEMLRRKKQEQDLAAQMHQMKFGQMQQEIEKQKAMEDAMVSFAKFKQGGSLPSSKIDGGEFYRAAEKHGLSTDNESLNRIVNLVNQGGHTPDSAAASLSGRNAPSSVQGYSLPSAKNQNDRVTGNYQPQNPLLKVPTQEAPQAVPQQGFNKGDIVKSQIAELMQQAKFYSSRPDYQSQMLAQQAQEKAIKLANELPKFANDFKVGRDKAGNLVNVRVADDGTETYSPTQVAEELHFGDNGQQLIASGKYSGNTKIISPKYQSLESIANIAIQRRGQDLINDRSKEANDIAKNNKIVDLSTSLRKEFEGLPEVKNYKEALPAYQAVIDAAKRNTPQADINLVYGIAKMYDPTSVVREGEYSTIVNSANIPDKIKGYAQYLAGGGKFTPEVKAALVNEAQGRMQSFDDQFKKARMDFEDISGNSGAKPSLLFPRPYKPAVQTPSLGSWDIKRIN